MNDYDGNWRMDGRHLETQVSSDKEVSRCPTCESPEPRLHPATQADGEVMRICQDLFHADTRASDSLGSFVPSGLKGVVLSDLRTELQTLLNRHSSESGSNTADFILARYLMAALNAFNTAVVERDRWYGVNLSPGRRLEEGDRG